MSRVVPFDPNDICDCCGKKGASDFMGDLICGECIDVDGDGYITGCSKKNGVEFKCQCSNCPPNGQCATCWEAENAEPLK